MLRIYYYTFLVLSVSGEVIFSAWSLASTFLGPDVISAVHWPSTPHKKLPIVFSSCRLTLFTSTDAHLQVKEQMLYCVFYLVKVSQNIARVTNKKVLI